jgi:tetratricopeptide (TPR) repeat protein
MLVLMGNSLSAQPDTITPAVRESHLQEALQLRKNEDYPGAIEKLNLVLAEHAQDAPILLLKGDLQLQSKQFAEAANTFKILLPLNFESTIIKINLSYALFMDRDAAQALLYAKSAWQNDSTNVNAIVNYFNAMLWNGKTREASQFVEKYGSELSGDKLLVMKARLYTTSGDYQRGLFHYDTLVKAFPDKYYIQEYAEVLLGKKEIKKASNLINESKELYSVNEHQAIAQKIQVAQWQQVATEFVYFNDIANNLRIENSVEWSQREGRLFRIGARAGIQPSLLPNKRKLKAVLVG